MASQSPLPANRLKLEQLAPIEQPQAHFEVLQQHPVPTKEESDHLMQVFCDELRKGKYAQDIVGKVCETSGAYEESEALRKGKK